MTVDKMVPCVGNVKAGLPDGLFSNQTPQCRQILVGLWVEIFCIFYDHLRQFGVFYGDFSYFVGICYIIPILVFCFKQKKSGNPA
jgi:hypothetical protein